MARLSTIPAPFYPEDLPVISEAERQLAQTKFTDTRESVDRAFEEIPLKLSRTRHRVQANLQTELVGGLQHVMAASLASAPVDGVSLDPRKFSTAAQTILGMLDQEQYLNTAVHLSGVSAQRTEAGSLIPRPKIGEALQDLIEQDNHHGARVHSNDGHRPRKRTRSQQTLSRASSWAPPPGNIRPVRSMQRSGAGRNTHGTSDREARVYPVLARQIMNYIADSAP